MGHEFPRPEPGHLPQVEIVVPVLNEERDLEPGVRRLVAYLAGRFPFHAVVTIADNGSTDGTWAAAQSLAAELPGVHAVRLERPGRGHALRSVWSASRAGVLAYMDVDLSTDLNALLPLVAPLLSGHSDLAIGTRLARGARVARGPRPEVISRFSGSAGLTRLFAADMGGQVSWLLPAALIGLAAMAWLSWRAVRTDRLMRDGAGRQAGRPHRALARLAATSRGRAVLAAVPVTLALTAALAGQAAYSIDTAVTAHTGAQITAWVRAHFRAGTVGGVAVYDLTKAR